MTMRGHNEGSIFKRGDGRWVAMISLKGGKRKSYYGKTRQEVQRRLATALRDQVLGLPVATVTTKLGDYLESHLEVLSSALKPRSLLRYTQVVHSHVIPTCGTTPLNLLTAEHIQELYLAKLREGLSPATVRFIHAVLHSSLKRAVRLGLIARNVADVVDVPRNKRPEIHPLSRSQARQLLDFAREDRLEALYVIALTTGMRQGELLALKWSDIDMGTAKIRVRATLYYTPKTGFTFSEPKTRSSRRTIRIARPALEALIRHRLRQEEEQRQLSSTECIPDLVFTARSGMPLARDHLVKNQFRPLLKRAGLPRIRFHDLRHTAATLLLGANVNPKVVSEMLGHSTVSITLDVYSHVLPDMQQNAAESLAALLF